MRLRDGKTTITYECEHGRWHNLYVARAAHAQTIEQDGILPA